MRRWQTGGRWGLGTEMRNSDHPSRCRPSNYLGRTARAHQCIVADKHTLAPKHKHTNTSNKYTVFFTHVFWYSFSRKFKNTEIWKKNWSSFYQRIQTNNDQLLWKEQDLVKRKTFSQVEVSTDIILVGRIKFWLKSGCKESSQTMFACHPLHRLVHYCIIPLLTFLQYPPQFFLHLLEFCSSHCCMQLRASHWLCALCRPEPVHQMRDNKKGWPNVLYWI